MFSGSKFKKLEDIVEKHRDILEDQKTFDLSSWSNPQTNIKFGLASKVKMLETKLEKQQALLNELIDFVYRDLK